MRARLIQLERAPAGEELRAVAAECQRTAETGEGALVVSQLEGELAALGRWQERGASAAPDEVRRWTGGRAWRYGSGIVSVCAIAPSERAWLDEPGPIAGPQLLNRYVRGLLDALRVWLPDVRYPGRDFALAGEHRVAGLSLERDAAGVLVFQAAIGLDLPYTSGADAVSFPGLPQPPPALALRDCARAIPFASLADALVEGFASRFSLDLARADVPPATIAPLSATALPPGRARRLGSVPIPIGTLSAFAELDAEERLSTLELAGDWIASSADVTTLQRALIGCHPRMDRARIEALAKRWLSAPVHLAIGVVEADAIARAICGEPETS